MYRITRIYLANAGYRLAWYPGLLLPFTDADTNLPTSTIYNLVNQGGKTTFLSLVLSVFDTRQDRFLQRLSNPGQHFEDYFDRDGLPGIIAVEWELPTRDLLSSSLRLVTGQLVCMRKSSEGLVADRHFFSFVGNETLSLESIPGPNLLGGARQLLRNRDDCLRWLHEMEQAHRGNFQRTTNQGDWEGLLHGFGLDVELLKKQVDFNRKEGAMDEAFLDFKSEQEFVSRFLLLTLNKERADETRKLVASLCRKMAGRQQLQVELAQMVRLGELFHPFAKAAETYREAQATRNQSEEDISAALLTLEAHRAGLSEKEGLERQHLQSLGQELAAQEGEVRRLEADMEVLESEQLERALSCATEQDGAAETQFQSAQHHRKLVDAAQVLDEMRVLEAEVLELQRAIAAANEDTKPLRDGLDLKVALYRDVLFKSAQAKHEETRRAKELALAFERVRGELVVKKEVAEGQWRDANHRAIQAATLLARAEGQQLQLVRNNILGEDEPLTEALGRVQAESLALTTRIEQLELEALHHETVAQQQNAEAAKVDEASLAHQIELAPIHQRINEGEALRESLAHNRALTKAAGAEVCDPDSEVLPSRVADLLWKEQERRREAELSLSRFNEGQQSYDLTGLFGQDPDVTKVVRFLSDQGVPGVAAYAEYIAATVPQAEAARQLGLSNPGRYLGVALPSVERLQQARQLLESGRLELHRPVVLSLYSTTPDASSDLEFVLAPLDDSLWNKEAAGHRSQQLALLLGEAERYRETAQRIADETLRAHDVLAHYREEFGEGKLSRMRTRATDLAALMTEANERSQELKLSARTATSRASDCRLQASDLQKQQLVPVTRKLQQLEAFHDEYDMHRPTWTRQRVEAENEKGQAQTAIDEAIGGIDRATCDRDEARHQASTLEVVAQELDDKRATLPPIEKKYDVEAELTSRPRTLAELETEYLTAARALQDIEEQKTAPLARERDLKSDDLIKKRAYYGESFPLDTFPMSEVRPLLGLDYRKLRKSADEAIEEKRKAHLVASSEVGHARAAKAEFHARRKYPSHVMGSLTDLSDTALSQEASSCRTSALKASQLALEAKRAALEAKTKADNLGRDIERYDSSLKTLSSLAPESSNVVADMSRFVAAEGLADEVARMVAIYTQAKKAVESTEKRAQQLYEAVRCLADDEAFAKADYEIALMLRENSLVSVAADATRIQNAIGNRIDALDHDLEQMAGDFNRATEALMGLVSDSIRIIKRATTGLLLPNHVPIVGGKSVFKLRSAVLETSQEQKKQLLSSYMEELVADHHIPETGAQLAAKALMRLADNRLNLRLLKMVEIEDEQYVPVDRLSHSGAEKISMALFLYFVTMRLRAEQQASSQRPESGVLLLDNPFAKATLRPIWIAIHSLAQAMGLQLIIATGMNELETLSVFKRHLRLGKTVQDKTTGRLHVRVTDYQFLPRQDVAV